MIISAGSFSQEMTISVSYLRGEKSKDSYSATENYSISGTSFSFSIKSTGRIGNEVSRSGVCTLLEKDTTAVRNLIIENELNKTDSLITESSKSSFPHYYTALSMSVIIDGVESKIIINGDTNEFADSEFYKKAIKFIMYLRNTAINCSKEK